MTASLSLATAVFPQSRGPSGNFKKTPADFEASQWILASIAHEALPFFFQASGAKLQGVSFSLMEADYASKSIEMPWTAKANDVTSM